MSVSHAARSIFTLLVICAPGTVLGQNTFAGSEALPVASVAGVTEYRLGNGLRVLLLPDPSRPTISVSMTYLVGSRHENYGESGLAHIIEHLVSYGSERHPNAEKERENWPRRASTTPERTNFYTTFPASDQNLAFALDFESDRMSHAVINEQTLKARIGVILNELGLSENNAQNALLRRVMAVAYSWSNVGKSTIGTPSDLMSISVDRVKEFYSTYYRPDNAVLIIAGNFNELDAMRFVIQKFAPISRPQRPLPHPHTVEPSQDGERTVILERAQATRTLLLAYHIPAPAHPDSAAVDVLTELLTRPNGRLHKALIESKKATSVSGQNRGGAEDGIISFLVRVPADGSLDEVKQAALSELDSLDSILVADSEAKEAAGALVQQFDSSMNDSEQVAHALAEYSAFGDWRLLFIYRDRLEAVTAENVKRVAAEYFKPQNRIVGMLLPTPQPPLAKIPPPPDLTGLVSSYKGSPSISRGEVLPGDPAALESRILRSSAGSGVTLALLPAQTRGSTVRALIRINYGDQNSLKHLHEIGILTRGMLSRGTIKHTQQELRNELNRLKASLSVSGGVQFTTLSVQTVRSALPDTLALVKEMLRMPVFSEAEFELLRQERLAQIETTRGDPQSTALQSSLQRLSNYPAGYLGYVYTPDEEAALVKAATIRDVRDFYADFYGGKNAEFVAVGDFEAAEVRSLAAEMFDGWDSHRPFLSPHRPCMPSMPSNRHVSVSSGSVGAVVAGLQFPLQSDDQDYAAALIVVQMLGGRMYQRLRNEGLSYDIRTQISPPEGDGCAQFTVSATAAASALAKVESALKTELNSSIRKGFAEGDVAEAKTAWSISQQLSRSREESIADWILSRMHEGQSLLFDAEIQKRIMSLKAEDVTSTLRRHWNLSQISITTADNQN